LKQRLTARSARTLFLRATV